MVYCQQSEKVPKRKGIIDSSGYFRQLNLNENHKV